jgi:hypothetical protein
LLFDGGGVRGETRISSGQVAGGRVARGHRRGGFRKSKSGVHAAKRDAARRAPPRQRAGTFRMTTRASRCNK